MYGHLRPGAYDVTAPRYDEDPDRYLSHAQSSSVGPTARQKHTGMSPATRREITVLLAELGLEIDARELIDFIGTSVRGREQAKFEFTHCLSDILRDIQLYGERLGFDRDEMSYVDIQTLMQATTAPLQAARRLIETAIAAGRERHAATCAISLPPLVTSASDVWAFEYPPTEPNFVGQSRCRAPVSDIAAHDSPEGTIAFVESADPGYDWLFASGIVGIVTAFGGVNSHMAIRANELGIPAAIGVGEVRYRAWLSARMLDLDARNRSVQVVA